MTQTEKMRYLECGNQNLVVVRDDERWSLNRLKQVIKKPRTDFFRLTRYPRGGNYLNLVLAVSQTSDQECPFRRVFHKHSVHVEDTIKKVRRY